MFTKFALFAVLVACASAGIVNPLLVQWQQFKQLHGKQYDETEDMVRMRVFEDNLRFISEHNARYAAGEVSYDVGVNQFADWTNAEFVKWLGAPQEADFGTEASTYMSPSNVGALPDTVDWRTKGYVTPVKDQGQCGSCWSFSATGALEGQHFKKTGKLVSLSEQNLVDCATSKYGNYGCNGGWPYRAYDYVKANHGIDTEASYPYHARDGKCVFQANKVGATLTGYTKLPSGNEDRLKESVATVGPISVCIDAGHMSFQLYKKGVYDEKACSSSRLDHAVLAVGYGSENGKDFWLVKNSWNTVWGEQGYIKMTRDGSNQCGIATAAVYPLV